MCFAFVDLEEAFDRVPKDVVWGDLRKPGIEEWLVKILNPMYRNTRSCVRVNETFKDDFLVHVVLNQGSMLNLLLFIIVIYTI